jgi:hypothetical protein
MPPATSNIPNMGSVSTLSAIRHSVRGSLPGSWLGPSLRRRRAASAGERPTDRDVEEDFNKSFMPLNM